MMQEARLYPVRVASRVSGKPPATLHNWDLSGYMPATGAGRAGAGPAAGKQYTVLDLLKLRLAVELDSVFSRDAIRSIFDLIDDAVEQGKKLFAVIIQVDKGQLLKQGGVCQSATELSKRISETKKRGYDVIVVDLKTHIADLESRLRELGELE